MAPRAGEGMRLGGKAPGRSSGRRPAALAGVIASAITPRREHESSIDLAATLELVDFLCRGGVDAIALLGATGEFVHFALDDRRHMFSFAAKRSRAPLLVNVSHSTLDGAVELAREAAEAGAAGVLLMPPYFFRYDQDAILSFYLAAAKEMDGAAPFYLYNCPACAEEIRADTAAALLRTGLFAGIEDSSGSWEYFEALRQESSRTPFTLLAGHDALYARARAAGANGVISGLAGVVPELLVALDKALQSGQADAAARLDKRLNELLERTAAFPGPAGIKEALRIRRLNAGALAAPLGEAGERKLAEFREWFRGWLAEVLRECGR